MSRRSYATSTHSPRSAERARSAFTPPALQAVTRDFAFLVPADLAADALVRAIRGADKALIADARLFDRYEGEQGLSLAVEVTLQPGAVRAVVALELLCAGRKRRHPLHETGLEHEGKRRLELLRLQLDVAGRLEGIDVGTMRQHRVVQ